MDVLELEKLVMTLITERREGRRGSVAHYNAWVRLADGADFSADEIEALIRNWEHMLAGQK